MTHLSKIGKELRFWLVLFSVNFLSTTVFAAKASSSAEDEHMREERLHSKPWYLRNTHILGVTIPANPVTLLTIVLSILNLMRGFFQKKSWAEASHILVDKHDDAAKKRVLDMKKDIGNDPMKFAKMAREHSSCPSSQNGGNLGRFNSGDMAPPFDRAVFDPQSPLEATIGPVQTTFGWHLIFIHKRFLNPQA